MDFKELETPAQAVGVLLSGGGAGAVVSKPLTHCKKIFTPS